MKFGSMIHELCSRNMAMNGGSTQKYEEINTFKQLVCMRGSVFVFLPNCLDLERIQPTHVPTLSAKISSCRIFPEKLIIQPARVHPR